MSSSDVDEHEITATLHEFRHDIKEAQKEWDKGGRCEYAAPTLCDIGDCLIDMCDRLNKRIISLVRVDALSNFPPKYQFWELTIESC